MAVMFDELKAGKKATVKEVVDLNAGGQNLVGLDRILRPIVLAEGVVLMSAESDKKNGNDDVLTPEGYPTRFFGVPSLVIYPSVNYEKPHRYIPGRYEVKNPQGYTCKKEQDTALAGLKSSIYSTLGDKRIGWCSRIVTRKEIEEGLDFKKLLEEEGWYKDAACKDLIATAKKIQEKCTWAVKFYLQAIQKNAEGDYFYFFLPANQTPDGLIYTGEKKEKKAKS